MQQILYSRILNVWALLCFVLLCFSKVSGDNHFGYITYSSYNIGDDIQSIAAKRFLPENSIAIDREFIGQYTHNSKIHTIVNGWYMHTKDFYWYRKDVKAPEKSWPPSPSIDPLLISIHFTKGFISTALSNEGIEYLKQHGPVGARDYYTLQELQRRNIPSYFSGCLTLTLENPYKEREDVIYAVDIDDECVNFIKAKTTCKVEMLTHIISGITLLNHNQRLKYAEKILEKYRKAKCVITSRFHASMPCLAFGTPVLLLNIQDDQYRFDGIRELVRNCSKEEFLNEVVDFNFEKPPENPKTYIPLRENLIKVVTDWVKSHSNTYENQEQMVD